MKRLSGFTIVELIVVVAVVGVIATIVTVNLNATVINSQNMTRVEEVKQIKSLFESYKARFQIYPEMTLNADSNRNYYCIGEGFPVVSGEQRCRDINSSTTRATVSNDLHTDLKKVSGGTLPKVGAEQVGGSVGPYVEFLPDSIVIYAVLESNTSTICQDNELELDWADSANKRVDCYLELYY